MTTGLRFDSIKTEIEAECGKHGVFKCGFPPAPKQIRNVVYVPCNFCGSKSLVKATTYISMKAEPVNV